MPIGIEVPRRPVYISDQSEDYWGAAMVIATDMLRPTEAAVVARVALRDVNRAIDERILPDGFFTVEGGRHVLVSACPLISFYFASAKHLTAEERLFAVREAGSRLHKFRTLTPAALIKEDWIVRDGFLTIDLAPFVRRTTERMDRLAAARALVTVDLDVLGGTPIILGTRIPVHDIAASVAAGFPIDRILAAYPALDAEKIDLATIYPRPIRPEAGRARTMNFPKGS
jgi:uncharacterized protein (DUF433 family)